MPQPVRAAALACLFLLLGPGLCAASHAAALRYCDAPPSLSAAQQDLLLRFAALIKTELGDAGQRVALVARSGLDLARFGQRYSHAGVTLLSGLETPWAVRQLYYACDERRPRLFDQGLTAFLLGMNDPARGFVSVVLLPAPQAQALERSALDKRQALQALGPAYSANAYAYGLAYQNCNQWLIELLATAWAPLEGAPGDLRAQAQRWLRDHGYEPTAFEAGLLIWPGLFVPWLHNADHPPQDLQRGVYRVSMPASIEAFVRATLPGASRIEFCRAGAGVVIHRGWEAIGDDCEPGANDRAVNLAGAE